VASDRDWTTWAREQDRSTEQDGATHTRGRTKTQQQEGSEDIQTDCPEDAPGWEQPIPIGAAAAVPDLPTDHLPGWMRDWVEAEAEATQTPVDLPAVLVLTNAGAAVAKKLCFEVRENWKETPNLYSVVSLLSGERKSTVFGDAIRPVQAYEREEIERMAPIVAAAASEHRMLEGRLKNAEQRAAKAADPEEVRRLRYEATQLAKEFAEHRVPELPQAYCDDETPEHLTSLLAKHEGRMFQASAEGTLFEIVKGRYADGANFEVYLKGHSGDPLRVGRVSRVTDIVERPALSVAVAVQPDVIRGLADQSSMRGRGFLARFLYCMPRSRVGGRRVAPAAVPPQVAAAYHENMLALRRLPWATGPDGCRAAHVVPFSPGADQAMRKFESWLEPQLADGQPLSYLAGWANKLAGAAARIAGILHVAAAVGEGRPRQAPVSEATAASAISLARYYFLPHAQAAFSLMGDDPLAEDARRAIKWLAGRPKAVKTVNSEKGVPLFVVSRRDLHTSVWGGSRSVKDVEGVLEIMIKHLFIRSLSVIAPRRGGRGRHASPRYSVNPAVFEGPGTGDPLSQNSRFHK
jgi:hypothetical protein